MATLNPAKSNVYFSAADQQYHYQKYKSSEYMNSTAIDNAIHYITRTGYRKDRAEDLFCWGTAGICTGLSPDDCIRHFKYIQMHCRTDRNVGSQIVHEIMSFSEDEEKFLIHNEHLIYSYANDCAHIYLNAGHVCVFGVHYGFHEEDIADLDAFVPIKKLHIHFVVNAVNHITGNKLRTCIGSKAFHAGNNTYYRIPYDTKLREKEMNKLLYEAYMHLPNPYHCESDMDYFSTAYPIYQHNTNKI